MGETPDYRPARQLIDSPSYLVQLPPGLYRQGGGTLSITRGVTPIPQRKNRACIDQSREQEQRLQTKP